MHLFTQVEINPHIGIVNITLFHIVNGFLVRPPGSDNDTSYDHFVVVFFVLKFNPLLLLFRCFLAMIIFFLLNSDAHFRTFWSIRWGHFKFYVEGLLPWVLSDSFWKQKLYILKIIPFLFLFFLILFWFRSIFHFLLLMPHWFHKKGIKFFYALVSPEKWWVWTGNFPFSDAKTEVYS